jgi:hypothetical protein
VAERLRGPYCSAGRRPAIRPRDGQRGPVDEAFFPIARRTEVCELASDPFDIAPAPPPTPRTRPFRNAPASATALTTPRTRNGTQLSPRLRRDGRNRCSIMK